MNALNLSLCQGSALKVTRNSIEKPQQVSDNAADSTSEWCEFDSASS